MTGSLPFGATMIRREIVDFLKTAYPEKRKMAATVWRVPIEQLPNIEKFAPYDIPGMDSNAGPTIGIHVSRTQDYKAGEIGSTTTDYQAVYSVQVRMYLFTPTDDSGVTIQNPRAMTTMLRDHFVALTRACFVDRPSLGTETLTVNMRTLAEEYPDLVPAPNNNQRFLAMGAINFDIAVEESIPAPSLGDAGQTDPNTGERKQNRFGVSVGVSTLDVDPYSQSLYRGLERYPGQSYRRQ